MARDPADLEFLMDNYRLACELGGDENRALRHELRVAVRRSQLVEIADAMDDALLGGALARAYDALRYPKGRLIDSKPHPGYWGSVGQQRLP